MRRNGPIALIFHELFVLCMLALLVAVFAVSFTDKGYLSLPTDGLSLRWFRTILDYPVFTEPFWMSLYLGVSFLRFFSHKGLTAVLVIVLDRAFGVDRVLVGKG